MATEASDINDLTKLDDPALIAQSAAARERVALNPRDTPARRTYAALRAEYQRRAHGVSPAAAGQAMTG